MVFDNGITVPQDQAGDDGGPGADDVGEGVRILVVDDEPEICEVLAETLTLSGNHWEVVREVDPEHALKRLRKERFDCLITDIVMPRMNGMELAKAAREISADLALIAVTGKATVSNSVEALKLGFHDLIQKPFDLEEVRTSVARSLTRHRRNRQTSERMAEMAQQNAVMTAQIAKLTEKLDLASHDLVLASKRLARQVRELGRDADVACSIAGIAELNDLLPLCAEIVADAVPCKSVTVALYQPSDDNIPVVARGFSDSEELPVLNWFGEPMTSGVLCRAARSMEVVHIEDASQCMLFADPERWLWQSGQVIVVPVPHKNFCIGAIALARADGEPRFAKADVRRLQQLVQQMAPGIAAARLQHAQRVQICESLEEVVGQLERRDYGFFGHGRRVAMYATLLAETLEISRAEIGILEIAARLHDIGRLDVPDSVLNKSAALSAGEMLMLQSHPKVGQQILSHVQFLSCVGELILAHHERVDGTGYPRGLNGPDIPFLARVLTLADVLDTMTSPRPHREARSLDDAIEEIQAHSNQQFDGQVVEALFTVERAKLEFILATAREPEPR